MNMHKPALIVVDVQNGFTTDEAIHVVPVIVGLVSRWQAAGGTVVFTRYSNYPESPYERLIGWYALHQSPEIDLVDELAPYIDQPNTYIIDKTVYTAFNERGRALFAEQGFTDLFICGIATDGCVLKTTLDAFEAGYTPWVIEDACASNASRIPPEEVHRSALVLMSRLVGSGQIIRSADALSIAGFQEDSQRAMTG